MKQVSKHGDDAVNERRGDGGGRRESGRGRAIKEERQRERGGIERRPN